MKIRFFYTPKPRQFTYRPIYYDSKKEAFEKLKKEYETSTQNVSEDDKKLLEYYEKRITELESERQTKKKQSFWSRKKIRKFNYQPRFQNSTTEQTITEVSVPTQKEVSYKEPLKMRRSLYYEDRTFVNAIKSSRILIYLIIAILLCIWIFA